MFRENAYCRAFSGLGFEIVRWRRSDTYLPLAAIGHSAMLETARDLRETEISRASFFVAVLRA